MTSMNLNFSGVHERCFSSKIARKAVPSQDIDADGKESVGHNATLQQFSFQDFRTALMSCKPIRRTPKIHSLLQG